MKKIFEIICLAVVLMVGANSAYAQTDNDEYVKATEEFLKVSNVRETMESTLVQTYQNMNFPVNDVPAMTNEILDAIWPEYIQGTAEILKKYYSLDDIKAFIDFYKTPSGEKFAKYSPVVAEEAAKMMNQPSIKNKLESIIMKYLNLKGE